VRTVTLKHRINYAAARVALWLIGLMPKTLAYGCAAALGRTFFRVARRRRRLGMEFLRLAFPEGKTDRELYRIGSRATGNLFKVPLDMIYSTKIIANGNFLDYVDVAQTREHMPDGPFIGVTAHLGSWEVAAIHYAAMGRETHVVVQSFKNPLQQKFISDNRRKTGLYLHRRRGGIRGLMKALARGCVGLQAVDQNQRRRGVFVPFFGKLASTERSAATLALRKGYPIMTGTCRRVGSGFRFKTYIDEMIYPKATGNPEEDVKRLARQINERLEKHILAAPDQYLWIHDRYRTRPSV
jgi:KDO2-lipid IV(A) lauroyltransferase